MSFDYPSGQGSTAVSQDCPNLHDLTEVLAVELGGLPDQQAPRQFEVAHPSWDHGASPPLPNLVSGPAEIFPVLSAL